MTTDSEQAQFALMEPDDYVVGGDHPSGSPALVRGCRLG